MIIDKQFFIKYQRPILWVINTRLGRWLFGVEKMGHNVGQKRICKITPNSVATLNYKKYCGKNLWEYNVTEQFFGRNMYGLKLAPYLFWMPVVGAEKKNTLNNTEWKLRPAYQLALMALGLFLIKPLFLFGLTQTTFNPAASPSSPVDGYTNRGNALDESVTTIRDGAGTGSSSNALSGELIRLTASTTSNQFTRNSKLIFGYDTSSIGAGATVSAAEMDLAAAGVGASDDFGTATKIAYVKSNAPADTTALANGDYSALTTTLVITPFLFGSGWTATDGTYNNKSITDLTVVSKTGITWIGVEHEAVRAGSLASNFGTWTSGGSVNGDTNYFADNGTSMPKLIVTYSSSAVKQQSDKYWSYPI